MTTWLRPAEAAEYCGVARSTFYEWVRERKVPTYRVGRAVLLKAEDIDKAIEKTARRAI
jgi:excisionase family DNA binding protein